MLMGFEPLLVFCVLFDETAELVSVMDRSWSFDTSYGVVIQETEFESQSGNHHLNVLNP